MNQEKIGKFISDCRKSKKMTQSELAEQLGVTDRSVSNWETGILLFKWHRYYFDVNTFIFSVFSFKILQVQNMQWCTKNR